MKKVRNSGYTVPQMELRIRNMLDGLVRGNRKSDKALKQLDGSGWKITWKTLVTRDSERKLVARTYETRKERAKDVMLKIAQEFPKVKYDAAQYTLRLKP